MIPILHTYSSSNPIQLTLPRAGFEGLPGAGRGLLDQHVLIVYIVVNIIYIDLNVSFMNLTLLLFKLNRVLIILAWPCERKLRKYLEL